MYSYIPPAHESGFLLLVVELLRLNRLVKNTFSVQNLIHSPMKSKGEIFIQLKDTEQEDLVEFL